MKKFIYILILLYAKISFSLTISCSNLNYGQLVFGQAISSANDPSRSLFLDQGTPSICSISHTSDVQVNVSIIDYNTTLENSQNQTINSSLWIINNSINEGNSCSINLTKDQDYIINIDGNISFPSSIVTGFFSKTIKIEVDYN